MTLADQDREQLISHHIQKCKQAVEDVRFLIDNKKLNLAANRIYYGLFYILSALALKHQFVTKNHGQLIGWFNREIVKTGKVDKKYSKIIRNAFEMRSDADYDVLTSFSKEETLSAFEEMQEMVTELEKLIK